jgi:hypothetical protein
VAAAYDAAPAVLCKIPIHFLCKDKERSAFFPCAIAIHMRQPPGFCKILIDSSKTSEDFQEK